MIRKLIIVWSNKEYVIIKNITFLTLTFKNNWNWNFIKCNLRLKKKLKA